MNSAVNVEICVNNTKAQSQPKIKCYSFTDWAKIIIPTTNASTEDYGGTMLSLRKNVSILIPDKTLWHWQHTLSTVRTHLIKPSSFALRTETVGVKETFSKK